MARRLLQVLGRDFFQTFQVYPSRIILSESQVEPDFYTNRLAGGTPFVSSYILSLIQAIQKVIPVHQIMSQDKCSIRIISLNSYTQILLSGTFEDLWINYPDPAK